MAPADHTLGQIVLNFLRLFPPNLSHGHSVSMRFRFITCSSLSIIAISLINECTFVLNVLKQ